MDRPMFQEAREIEVGGNEYEISFFIVRKKNES